MKIEALKNLWKTMKAIGAKEATFCIDSLNPIKISLTARGDCDNLFCTISDTDVNRNKIDEEYLIDLHIEAEKLNIQKEERIRLIRKIKAYLLYTNRGKVDDKLNEFLEDQLK